MAPVRGSKPILRVPTFFKRDAHIGKVRRRRADRSLRHGDATAADDVAPLLGIRHDELAQLLRRAGDGMGAQLGKPVTQVRIVHGRSQLRVQLGDDLLRSSPRGEQRDPTRTDVGGNAGFRAGGHIGQRRRP